MCWVAGFRILCLGRLSATDLRRYQSKAELFRSAACSYRLMATAMEQKLREFRCLPENSKVCSKSVSCAGLRSNSSFRLEKMVRFLF